MFPLRISQLSTLSVFFMGAMLPLQAEPQVHVGRVAEAPLIGPSAEGSAWEQAIGIRDFIVPGNGRPMMEGSDVRFLWDQKALYVRARLEESIFSTASQQQSEIVARATNRDGAVLSDDSFVLIIRPPGGDLAYEFNINTKGTVADMRSKADALWSSRDLAWDAEFASHVEIEDGAWVAWLAIPWSDLGADAPRPGERWHVLIARHAAARKETGAWAQTEAGFHAPVEWGALIFGEKPPLRARFHRPEWIQRGKNEFDISIEPDSEGGSLFVSAKLDQGVASRPPSRSRKAVGIPLNGEPRREKLECELGEGDRGNGARLSWSLLDANTLGLYYQSPQIKMDILTSNVSLSFSTTGRYRLIVNEQTIQQAEHGGEHEVSLPLKSGVNVIALETGTGTAALSLSRTLLGDAPIRWKMRPLSEPDATPSSVDDSLWQTAPEQGGQVGIAGQPAILRHTVVVNGTRFFPAPDPALYIARGITQPFSLVVAGLQERHLREWALYLTPPDGVSIAGASGFYGASGSKAQFHLKPEGEGARQFRIDASGALPPFSKGQAPIMALLDIGFRIDGEPAGETDDSTPLLRYYSRANDHTLSELIQEVPVRTLPAVQGKQPKKLTFQLWGHYTSNLDASSMRDDLLKAAETAGFTVFTGVGSEDAKRFNMSGMLLVNFKSYSLNFQPWLEAHPEARLTRATGEREPSLPCMTRLLDDAWKTEGDRLFKAWWERRQPDIVNYDFEDSPFIGHHACYCAPCLDAFKAEAKLAPGSALTAQQIREEYPRQWIDFMTRRVAKLLRLMRQSVHQLPRPIIFEVYSGYQTVENNARYGINWAHVAEEKGADRVGVGYGRPKPGIQETIDSLPGIPVLFGQLITPYLTSNIANDMRPSQQVTKAALLRRFIDATGGALVYNTQSMDGRSWYAAGEVSRLIHDHETIFAGARRSPVDGLSEAEATLLEHEDGTVLCFMNGESSERSYRVTPPANLDSGTEYYSGRAVTGGKELHVTLGAGECAAYIFPKAGANTRLSHNRD